MKIFIFGYQLVILIALRFAKIINPCTSSTSRNTALIRKLIKKKKKRLDSLTRNKNQSTARNQRHNNVKLHLVLFFSIFETFFFIQSIFHTRLDKYSLCRAIFAEDLLFSWLTQKKKTTA